ncbi:hypothetical protein LIA77_08627 [Sarocladium implicatum]|nr:hypothetical protein LIA77_08627 [Sarocladium implicatum]
MSPPHGPLPFTFVNTTGQAALDQQLARKVRGHVTKANFARRRQLKGVSAASEVHRRHDREILLSHDADEKILVTRPPTRALYDERETVAHILLTGLREIMFPMKFGEARTASVELWKEVFLPEPSLMICCVAAACRHRSIARFTGGPSQAIVYENRAMRLVCERLAVSDGFKEDGILGTVLSLANSHKLYGNVAVAAQHAAGLTQIIGLRRVKGIATPIWFREALLFNYFEISNDLAYFRPVWPSVGEAMSVDEARYIADMASILQRMVILQRNVNLARKSEMPTVFVKEQIETALSQITDAALGMDRDLPQCRAFAIGFALFAHFSWQEASPTESRDPRLGSLARVMMEEMKKPGIRLCSYMQWTVWQLILGSLAASDQDTKNWYIESMRAIAALPLGMKSSEIMDYILAVTIRPNPHLLPAFRASWQNLDLPNPAL